MSWIAAEPERVCFPESKYIGSPWQTDLTFRTFKLLGWHIMCLTMVVVLFASWITNSCMLYEI